MPSSVKRGPTSRVHAAKTMPASKPRPMEACAYRTDRYARPSPTACATHTFIPRIRPKTTV